MATNEFYIPELQAEYMEDTLFKLDELTALIKGVIANVLGELKYDPKKIFDHTNDILDNTITALTGLGKPFKYIVTCTLSSKGYGTATYKGHQCNWDRKNDNYLSLRWENASLYTIVTVYGLALFNVAGWPKDRPQVLCAFTPRRYEMKHVKEEAIHTQKFQEERMKKIKKHKEELLVEIARTKELQMKRSRRFQGDMAANRFNCVNDDDVEMFELVEDVVREFEQIMFNPDYYQEQEEIKAQAAREEEARLQVILEEEEELEEQERLAALEARMGQGRAKSVQF